MKKSFILILIVLFSIETWAQEVRHCDYKPPREASNWFFGNGALLNFDLGVQTSESIPNVIDLSSNVAVISDPQGSLLFYSDGVKVYNQNHQVMKNGQGINGNDFATQPAIIVPQPKSSNYYLFTVDLFYPGIYENGFCYHIINMKGGNGFGEVTEKNKRLLDVTSQKIAAVKHTNGKSWWILTHGFGAANGNSFYAYLLDESGLSTAPIISESGSWHSDAKLKKTRGFNNSTGQMKFSSDGKHLALSVVEDGFLEIFDFDAATGTVVAKQVIQEENTVSAYGLEFSTSGNYLYLTTSPIQSGASRLLQFELLSDGTYGNETVLENIDFDASNGNDVFMGALQLAPDRKIYVGYAMKGTAGVPYVGVIYNPERKGAKANFNSLNNAESKAVLNGALGRSGLGNFAVDYVASKQLYGQNLCKGDISVFRLTNTANIDQVDWEITGVAGTDSEDYPDIFTANIAFSEIGMYNVKTTSKWQGESYEENIDIEINELPKGKLKSLGDTIYIIPNTSYVLDPGSYDEYLWEPSMDTNRFLNVSKPGVYYCTYTDYNCCSSTDTITVLYGSPVFPNAFNPRSSIPSNRVFRQVAQIKNYVEYNLYVYNRWGQLIFHASSPEDGWDGSIDGEMAPEDTYAFVCKSTILETNGETTLEDVFRGTVTLIR